MDYLLIIYDKLIVWILVNSTIQVQIPSIKLRRPPEVRIYKRKQEKRKKELDQESDQEKKENKEEKKNSTKKTIKKTRKRPRKKTFFFLQVGLQLR